MNISIVATLDTRYTKKDQTCAVIIRIGRDNKTLPIPTNYSVPVKYWNENKREVKSTYQGVENVTRLNNLIGAELKLVRDTVNELKESGAIDTLTLMQIKQRIVKGKSADSFFFFADEIISKLNKANRIGTRDAYQDAINALEKYNGNRLLGFKQITFEYLSDFETNHLSKGNRVNGLAAYLRAIRAIYNLGIKSGLVDEKYYPFKKYQIKTEPTSKRALKIDPLTKIFNLKLEAGHACFNARNYFVISYMLYGMNFYDMALLKRSNIVDGRIRYQRNKTSRPYDVKITPALQLLLAYYKNDTSESLFSIVKRNTAQLIHLDIEGARQRYNKKLKRLAKMCDIETNLTSYVSRHSFATQARLKKVPIDAISAMLGHTSVKTTEIYLDSLPLEILDDYNELVIGN